MATTLIGQNGAQKSATIPVTVAGCGAVNASRTRTRPPVALMSHRFPRGVLHLRIRVLAAGRLSVGGTDLRTGYHRVKRAGVVSLSLRLRRAGLAALQRRRRIALKVRVGFIPARKGRSTVRRATMQIKA